MDTPLDMLLSQRELSQRWSKSESSISWCRAVGVGPGYVKVHGEIMYSVDEIQKYERACLFFNPADVAFEMTTAAA
jgi:hypothetical protein